MQRAKNRKRKAYLNHTSSLREMEKTEYKHTPNSYDSAEIGMSNAAEMNANRLPSDKSFWNFPFNRIS